MIDVYLKASNELNGFLFESPKFRKDLVKLIIAYTDKEFLQTSFSPMISSLVRTMSNPLSMRISICEPNHQEIKKAVKELAKKHPASYDIFVRIIRCYAWNNHDNRIGYCRLARIIMGEPYNSVMVDPQGYIKFMVIKFIKIFNIFKQKGLLLE